MIRGYKVFGKDWMCRGKQYSCPGVFEEGGKLELCKHGMHFCKTTAKCFDYYPFDPENHVAEVIAHGAVLEDGNKCCTDKLEIVREIPWDEVLRLVNTGDGNTGDGNTGDRNTGDWNAGNWNTGDRNTGDGNTGDRNTGNRNTGDRNTGNRNTGDRNAGNWNTGNRNTGDENTGDGNTGNGNTGDWNTGDWNAGNGNTGNRNTGDGNTGNGNTGNGNTGDWNLSSHSSGCFNTVEPKIYLFDKPSDWTYRDWRNSEACYLMNHIDKHILEWIRSYDMTDEEKTAHPEHRTTGGYLKKLDVSKSAQVWWDELSDCEREIIKAIPNFDPKIFCKITGIKNL